MSVAEINRDPGMEWCESSDPPPAKGRKHLGERKRQGRELTLSPAAWTWLEWYKEHAGLGTVSQAVEIIVRTHGEFSLDVPATK